MEGAYNDIGVGRYNRLAQRLLQVKAAPPMPTLAGELSASLVLECDRPEWKFLGGERLLQCSQSIAAAAGLPSTARLRNPRISGVLAIVEGLIAGSDSNNLIVWGIATTITANLANAANPGPLVRDSRGAQSGGAASCIVTTDNVGIAANIIGRVRVLASTPTPYLPVEIVLGPGGSIEISATTNNTILDFTILWRERMQEESE